MSSIEKCLSVLVDVLSELDLVLERFDDERTEDALQSAVDLAEQLSDQIGELVDAFDARQGDLPSDLLELESLPPHRSPQSDSDE